MGNVEDPDRNFAQLLQYELDSEYARYEHQKNQIKPCSKLSRPISCPDDYLNSSKGIIDPNWELVDPTPNILNLFIAFNEKYFWGKLLAVTVVWSNRMMSCAGICSYEGRGGLCKIALSEPLLKLRPRKDLVETLLHEMIHAYLFVTDNNRDRDGHGAEFHKHMDRINTSAGTKISVYHTFHDEVRLYQQHWWRCDGPCQSKHPFYGMIRRSINRAPGPSDRWFADHQRTCGGKFIKVKEPEKKQTVKEKASPKAKRNMGDIRKYLNTSASPIQTGPSTSKKIKNNGTNFIHGFHDLIKAGNSTKSLNNNNITRIANSNVVGFNEFKKPMCGSTGLKSNSGSTVVVRNTNFKPTKDVEMPYTSTPKPVQMPYTSTPKAVEMPYTSTPKPVEMPYTSTPKPVEMPYTSTPKPVQMPYTSTPKPAEMPYTSTPKPVEMLYTSTPKRLIGTTENNNYEVVRKHWLNRFECMSPPPKRSSIEDVTESPAKRPKTSSIHDCPICWDKFSEDEINAHIDECLVSSQTRVKCERCGDNFTACHLNEHYKTCPEQSDCPICQKKIPNIHLEQHVNRCIEIDLASDDSIQEIELNQCGMCTKYFPPKEFDAHVKNCIVIEVNDSFDEEFDYVTCKCGKQMDSDEYKTHKTSCNQAVTTNHCHMCKTDIEASIYADHLAKCCDKMMEDIPSTSNETVVEKVPCLICDKLIVKSDLEEHLEVCLDGTVANITEYDDDFIDDGDSSDVENAIIFHCPVCLKLIKDADMNSHLDDCLKK